MGSMELLLSTLGRELVRGPLLCSQLKISKATLSRLVSAAPDHVCRMGRTRAALYARTRVLKGVGSKLPVFRISQTGALEPQGEMRLLLSGGHWLEGSAGKGELFVGLPPFAVEMSPQGFLGRNFSARHAELEVPPRLADWNDDHRLLALARRGEDCVGNIVLGKESVDRWLAASPVEVTADDYPRLAHQSQLGETGSSAGGEQPKFTAWVQSRHLLVKFVQSDDGAAARRWRDLLVCESLALETLAEAGVEAARARWLDVGGGRFLEVERFDRLGPRGRRGLLSLMAIDNEHLGVGGSWTQVVLAMLERQLATPEDARRVRLLDVFGQLIGNSDRHLGNLSFYVEGEGSFRLAPAYDMLPMGLAPVQTSVVDRPFEPRPPTVDSFDVWPEAARLAQEFWARAAACSALTSGFQDLVARMAEALNQARRRFA
jgi:hypothetical protein